MNTEERAEAKRRKMAKIKRWLDNGHTVSDIAGFLKVSRQRSSQLVHECGVYYHSPPKLMRHETATMERPDRYPYLETKARPKAEPVNIDYRKGEDD